VAENDVELRGLDLLQKYCDAVHKFPWVVEHPARKRILSMTTKPEIGGCKIGTAH
jgi:hypothetical protein